VPVAKQGTSKKTAAKATTKSAAAKRAGTATAGRAGAKSAKSAAPARSTRTTAKRAIATAGRAAVARPMTKRPKQGAGNDFKPGSGAVPAAVRSNQPPRGANPPPPPAPVPTDGKPRKNQAGLTSKELEFYRGLLLDKRRELVGDMSQMEREALRSASGTNLSNLPVHMADMGTDNYEQEFTLGLVEKDRVLLREINHALGKIQDGTYGICEGTGKPIGKPRLEAQPWARFSIEYARQMERPFGR
jgi:DnaK suppressor protein